MPIRIIRHKTPAPTNLPAKKRTKPRLSAHDLILRGTHTNNPQRVRDRIKEEQDLGALSLSPETLAIAKRRKLITIQGDVSAEQRAADHEYCIWGFDGCPAWGIPPVSREEIQAMIDRNPDWCTWDGSPLTPDSTNLTNIASRDAAWDTQAFDRCRDRAWTRAWREDDYIEDRWGTQGQYYHGEPHPEVLARAQKLEAEHRAQYDADAQLGHGSEGKCKPPFILTYRPTWMSDETWESIPDRLKRLPDELIQKEIA